MTLQYCLQKIMLRIKLADSTDINGISHLCVGSLLGTKILCQVTSYGFDRDFLYAWLCLDEEKSVGVIMKFEDSITLQGTFNGYSEDVRAFLDMIGFSTVCCTQKTAQCLGFSEAVTKNKKAYIYTGDYNGEIITDLSEELYRKSYSLISRNIPGSFSATDEAYLSFLSDFTFRHRRNSARIKGCTEDGDVLSCALTSAETASAAIISGVASDIGSRKKGLGKKTVLSLAQELKSENKTVYVIALNEKAEGFYEHIGFNFTETISFIERK